MPSISHCLWFDGKAEEAANFYTSVFKGGKVGKIARYPDTHQDTHGQKPGSVMTAEFEILGQKYLALNGGDIFKFNEAFSIVVTCDTQAEIDHYWSQLTGHGGQEVQCGWLKDRFGLCWQIVPRALGEMMTDPDPKKNARVMEAFMKMKKFDIAALEKAFRGNYS